jgi:hypothetical protein
MSSHRLFCFVIMPFRPELHYLYLFLKRHIEERHNIDCERGDAQILTKPLLDKIADYIRRADVIIADCTGRNANVFYELGMAHAIDKKVILLTQDDIREAPADIRHYEFIKYTLSDEKSFIANIDNALQNVFGMRYDVLYTRAQTIFKAFREETKLPVVAAPKENFIGRISSVEKTRDLPSDDDEYGNSELLLPRIIADSSDFKVMSAITEWLSKLSPKKP